MVRRYPEARARKVLEAIRRVQHTHFTDEEAEGGTCPRSQSSAMEPHCALVPSPNPHTRPPTPESPCALANKEDGESWVGSLAHAWVTPCPVEDETTSLCFSDEDFRGRHQEAPKMEEALREGQ